MLDYFYKSSVSVFTRTNESDVITRHKVKVIMQKIQNLKVCLPPSAAVQHVCSNGISNVSP